MFRVDETYRLPMPTSLLGDSEHAAYYPLVEATLNQPVWLLHVTALIPSEEIPRRRRLLVNSLPEALRILEFGPWLAGDLYAVLPEHLTGAARIIMGQCSRIWACEEPDSEELCWRIETDHGCVLYSELGTRLGEECNPMIVWSSIAQDSA